MDAEKNSTKSEESSVRALYEEQIDRFKERLVEVIGNESVRSFSSRCGISESVLRKYLNGSYPNMDKLPRIAEASGRTMEWLLTGEDKNIESQSYDPNSQLDVRELELAIKAVKSFAKKKGAKPSDSAFAKAVAIVYTLDAHDEPLSKELIRKVASYVI